MAFFTDALLGVGAQAGNIFSTIATNNAQVGLSREQMAFQERMSSTAHKREVEDLKSAGLNPILSAGGNGASSPSGSMANLTAPQIDLPAMMNVASLAQGQQKIEIEKANAEVDRAKNIAETAATTSSTPLKNAAIQAAVEKMKAEVSRTRADTRLKQKGAIRADVEGKAATVIDKTIDWLKAGFQKHWGNSQPPGSASRPTNKPFIDDGWLTNSVNPDN